MKIRALTAQDLHLFEECLRLLNRTQGDGLFQADYIVRMTANESARVYVALPDDFEVAGGARRPAVLGVGVAQLVEDFKFYEPFGAGLEQLFAGKKIGSFSTLAVHEDYQGQGIGQKISRERLAWLRSQKVDCIIGISWVSGLRHTSDRVFEKMGFKNIAVAENFFGPYSLEKNFVCPGCGGPPCKCPSILYMKTL